jgi:hypothetical protein
LSDESLYTHLRIYASLKELLACDRHVATLVPILRLNIEVCGPEHAILVTCLRVLNVRFASHAPGNESFLAFFHAQFPSLLNCISLLVLHITHFIENVDSFTDFATKTHERILVEILNSSVTGRH